MKIAKRFFVVAVVMMAGAIFYLWGHTDGSTGRTFGLTGEAVAAETSSGLSPVKARARDFYAPNSEDLGPDEMRFDCLRHRHAHGAPETGGVVLAARTGER